MDSLRRSSERDARPVFVTRDVISRDLTLSR